jgi:hypothetical protein
MAATQQGHSIVAVQGNRCWPGILATAAVAVATVTHFIKQQLLVAKQLCDALHAAGTYSVARPCAAWETCMLA